MAKEENENPAKLDPYHYLVGVVSFGPKHWFVSFPFSFQILFIFIILKILSLIFIFCFIFFSGTPGFPGELKIQSGSFNNFVMINYFSNFFLHRCLYSG